MENAARISMLQTAKKRPQRSRRHISLYQFHHPRPIHVSKHWHMPKWPGDYVEWVHDSHWNKKPSYSKVSSQSSHQKSPKSPLGGIFPNLFGKTYQILCGKLVSQASFESRSPKLDRLKIWRFWWFLRFIFKWRGWWNWYKDVCRLNAL